MTDHLGPIDEGAVEGYNVWQQFNKHFKSEMDSFANKLGAKGVSDFSVHPAQIQKGLFRAAQMIMLDQKIATVENRRAAAAAAQMDQVADASIAENEELFRAIAAYRQAEKTYKTFLDRALDTGPSVGTSVTDSLRKLLPTEELPAFAAMRNRAAMANRARMSLGNLPSETVVATFQADVKEFESKIKHLTDKIAHDRKVMNERFDKYGNKDWLYVEKAQHVWDGMYELKRLENELEAKNQALADVETQLAARKDGGAGPPSKKTKGA
jgi:hypothetical protein